MHDKLSLDELEMLTEKELRQHLRNLESSVNKLRRKNQAELAVDVEVEICYVQRELELRARYSPKRNYNQAPDVGQIEFETAV